MSSSSDGVSRLVRNVSLATTAPVGVLLAVLLLGLLHTAYPLGGDQALFLIGAVKMHHGAVLYRDFWDLKQPGIYLFFLIAGTLFGFSARGIHFFELLYLLAFCVMLQRTVGRFYRFRFTAWIVPLLVAGVFYANADEDSLTQVESLIGFPVYASLYFMLAGFRDESRRLSLFAAAGITGALILVFKLIFLPLILALWVAIIAMHWHLSTRDKRSSILYHTGLLAVIFTACTALWMGATIAISGKTIVWETFFSFPVQIARTFPLPPIQRLIHSVRLYAQNMFALVALMTVAVLRGRHLWRNALWVGCTVWVVAGIFVIVLQRQSWWPYQMHLLDVPIALMAAFGLEALWAWRTAARRADVLRVAFLAGALAIGALAIAVKNNMPARSSTDGTAIAFAETRFLNDPDALTGDMYVCGDPRFYLAANRTQPIAINGWSLELLLPVQWTELRRELLSAHPAYIFVSAYYERIIQTRSRDVAQLLRSEYRPLRHDVVGRWYVRSAE